MDSGLTADAVPQNDIEFVGYFPPLKFTSRL
jgi:hypothetical protein